MFNFHIQASYWIGEKLAFNTSSFETNQIQKLEFTYYYVYWSWENYFRESTWSFGHRSWTFQYSITSNPTYRWKHWGQPLVSTNDPHSVTIWPWVYKDIFHFTVSIITPKRFPTSNKWTKEMVLTSFPSSECDHLLFVQLNHFWMQKFSLSDPTWFQQIWQSQYT